METVLNFQDGLIFDKIVWKAYGFIIFRAGFIRFPGHVKGRRVFFQKGRDHFIQKRGNMAKKSQHSFVKRQKELKRAQKAREKRERRQGKIDNETASDETPLLNQDRQPPEN